MREFFEENKGLAALFAICIIVVVFLLGAAAIMDSEEVSHIYHSPGICPICGETLEKTVRSGRFCSEVVWYCPNNNCR